MLDWLDGIAGPDYARAILWTLAALILLVVVLVIVKLIRSMTFGTFVAGGRNRKTRLAVMDATAVDSHRRLVLVRRDDIEHLLLIGGPTDVVVERDIRLVGSRRPAPAENGGQAIPAPRMQPVPASARQAEPKPATREPQPAHQRDQAVRPSSVSTSTTAAGISPPTYPAVKTPAPHAAPRMEISEPDDIDAAFMSELDVSLEDFSSDKPTPQPSSSKRASASLDDEMTKLLGELSTHKK
ncbi:MAG TPA: hypothetical protein VGM46_01240 [Mesorhizobium sp.]